MGMRHVRLKKEKVKRLIIESHLTKSRKSRVEKIIDFQCKQFCPTNEFLSKSSPVMRKITREETKIEETKIEGYGLTAIGKEKRKGRSIPPKNIDD